MNGTTPSAALASLLTGRSEPHTAIADVDADSFWDEARRHGVAPLAAEAITQGDRPVPFLLESARATAAGEIAADLLGEAELRRLLEALHLAGVNALLFKGSLLAYTHYARPDLRPRLDVDLVIPVIQRDMAHAVLTTLGYEGEIQASSDLVLHQRPYARTLHGQSFVIDLHWRLTNPAVFGHVLSFDEMDTAAVNVPALSPYARGLSAVHSLLVACVHRVAHHAADERLIWLFDIHVIASRLTPAEWSAFVSLAVDRRVRKVCQAGLLRSGTLLGTLVPPQVWDGLGSGNRETEVTAEYLKANRSRILAVLDDLRALRTWRDRGRLLRDYAFPPVNYMRGVYAPSSELPLTWLYMRRMFFGAWKWTGLSARHS